MNGIARVKIISSTLIMISVPNTDKIGTPICLCLYVCMVFLHFSYVLSYGWLLAAHGDAGAGSANSQITPYPTYAAHTHESGMTSNNAGIMLATGNCLMPQIRKPVASMISPPQAEKSASMSAVVSGMISVAPK